MAVNELNDPVVYEEGPVEAEEAAHGVTIMEHVHSGLAALAPFMTGNDAGVYARIMRDLASLSPAAFAAVFADGHDHAVVAAQVGVDAQQRAVLTGQVPGNTPVPVLVPTKEQVDAAAKANAEAEKAHAEAVKKADARAAELAAMNPEDRAKAEKADADAEAKRVYDLVHQNDAPDVKKAETAAFDKGQADKADYAAKEAARVEADREKALSQPKPAALDHATTLPAAS